MKKRNTEPKQLSKPELLNLLLDQESKEINQMDEMVDLLVAKNVSINVNQERNNSLTFGEKMSEALTKFSGSWGFIIAFIGIVAIWIGCNIYMLTRAFDPFPFVFLNLVLGVITSLQAPVILMSQNRQEKKDRMRSENDYKIDLKAEFILEDMFTKLKRILNNQNKINERLDEIENKINSLIEKK